MRDTKIRDQCALSPIAAALDLFIVHFWADNVADPALAQSHSSAHRNARRHSTRSIDNP
jgi:hypothetical protein